MPGSFREAEPGHPLRTQGKRQSQTGGILCGRPLTPWGFLRSGLSTLRQVLGVSLPHEPPGTVLELSSTFYSWILALTSLFQVKRHWSCQVRIWFTPFIALIQLPVLSKEAQTVRAWSPSSWGLAVGKN